ncbi:uncharacterized protein LOC126742400 [Anthonomus grandis grandis]|uniref:uncharacterized protein LOC126742400 n=1 Tax=Anthonomus grandis grandis TaxID=2921223 RepID=UPI002166A74C|nr:uncharacterized protein LOC126742400 [Anthonomus grandis grandis]
MTFWICLVMVCLCVSRGGCNEPNTIGDGVETHLEKSSGVAVSTQSWRGSLFVYPTVATWTVQTSIPLDRSGKARQLDDAWSLESRGKKGGMKKKMRRYMMPLLIAYKLKFFTLIPVMIGGLILLTGATGLAGFFFALFAAVMGLKSGGHH